MLSIKARLALWALFSIAALLGLGGTAIYYAAQANLMQRFDQKLRIQAYSIMTATYQKDDREVEVHFTDRFLHEFNSIQRKAFYQIWKDNGKVVKRSDSLHDRDLPKEYGKENEPKYWNLPLPNDLPGRAIGVRYEPRTRGNRKQDFNKGFNLILVMATDLQEVDTALADLRNLLLFAGLATMGLSPLFVYIALGRGLAPLASLANKMGAIDASALATQVSDSELPAELKPIARQLNELIARLRDSFERERRFSADVAHELRTPIAGLRNIAEIGMKWAPADSDLPYDSLRTIAFQMERSVTQLLELSRCDNEQLKISPEDLPVGDVIRQCWEPHQALAASRGLSIQFEGIDGVSWKTDRALFVRIIDNLLENAASYTTDGGCIHVSATQDGSAITFANDCDQLDESDIAHLFDRFWRKDHARSSEQHSGLGLAVAQAFAQKLGLTLSARLKDSRALAIELKRNSDAS